MDCETSNCPTPDSAAAALKRASVIVPVRNGERTLDRCLEAIFASEGIASFEVIVVDDGSTDTSATIACRFSVRLIHCPEGRGPAAARNRGAAEARTPCLMFVDADVFVKPDSLQRLLRSLDTAPAAFGSYDPEPLYQNFATAFYHTLSCRSIADTAPKTEVFYSYCAAIRKDLFLDVGGFNTRFTRATFEDMELGCALAERGLHCSHRKDVEVLHAVRYDLKGLANAYFRKSRDLAILLLSRRSMSLSDQGWTHRKNWVVLASAWGMLGFPTFALWSRSLWLLPWMISIAVFLAASFEIARSMARRRWIFGPLAVAGYLAVNVIATGAMFAALGSRLGSCFRDSFRGSGGRRTEF
jgi:glycosyltransferase involved in cell wall biosynthesis